MAAGRGSDTESRDALAQLIEGYWYPVYGFVRGKGYSEADASDLVQSFFATLLEKRRLDGVRPDIGRFRSFLLVSMRNFLTNEWEARMAEKRGGKVAIETFDTDRAEARLSSEVNQLQDVERAFDRRWALTVLQRAVEKLEQEFAKAGQTDRFESLRGLLTGQGPTSPYEELAEKFGMSVAGVKSLVHRMRKRFGVLLRGEVRQTLDPDESVEDEIRYLLSILSEGS